MSLIQDRCNTIVGDAIMRDQDTGQVEVFSDSSGVAINAASGDICFKDQWVTAPIMFSDSGNPYLQTVNGENTIIGVLNMVGRFYISGNDTYAGFAEEKIVTCEASGITINVLNEGGNEQLEICVNPSALADAIEGDICHNALDCLQGGVSGEYYHLTAQELIDLTSGLSADNQHFHNASAIVVDDGCFEIVSGTELQEVLCVIDELLKIRNTMLVNFDIGGSIRNGNTKLGINNNVSFVQFKDNKCGIMAHNARVPENYIEGTALVLRIKWYSLGNDTDDVYWRLTYKGVDDGENVSIASTVVDVIDSAPGTAGELVETEFAISSSAFAQGDLMSFELRRLGDDVLDTSTEDVRLVEFSLDY